MSNEILFFDKMKRKNKLFEDSLIEQNIFFMITFGDSNGVYLDVVDCNKNKISVSHEHYSGAVREVLRTIETISDSSSFNINWGKKSDLISISENEQLLWQLLDCNNLVNEKLKKITLSKDYCEIVLSLKDEKTKIIGGFIALIKGKSIENFRFLNESHIFYKNKIYNILPLGENYNDLVSISTEIPKDFIENYLSLLYSYFDNFSITYLDYNSKKQTDYKETVASIIFEEIDENESLHLKISGTVQGFDASFFDKYDLKKIVTLNELDKTINIFNIKYNNIKECYDDVDKTLKKINRSLKKDTDFYIDENFFIIDSELAIKFVFSQLTYLMTKYSVFGSDKLKKYKIKPVSPKLNINVSHGIDFFEGEAVLEIEEETYSVFDIINSFTKNSYITLSDGTSAIINKEYISKLKRIFKKGKSGNEVKISFFDTPLVEELIDNKTAAKTFEQSREVFKGFNKLQKSKPKYPKVDAELRDYQKEGYKWLEYLHKISLGGCLADDMGLGKTLQTITLLSLIYRKTKEPSLIVMPKSLLFNWENEILKFNKKLSFYTYYENNRDIKKAKKKNLIFTTYALMRNDIEIFKKEKFHYIILDESQNIKNINAQTSKAVMLLSSKHRLALSGTPIENNLGELYSLFRFLNPSMFGSFDEFNKYYQVPIQKNNDKTALKELKKKIYPFILRRLKKDVLTELPDKIEKVMFVEMSKEQKKFYEERRAFYYTAIKSQVKSDGINKSQFFIFQALNELRQIATIPEVKTNKTIISSKRELLVQSVKEAVSNGHKVLVFANFLNAVELISENLDEADIKHLIITGATKKRKELVEKFQNEKKYKVFLLTLKTGGTGLNLTAADHIFIFDPWWNVAAENQAIDRAHRIGQDKTVFSYKLITKDTIEEKILKLQEHKKKLFDALISSDGASIKSLSEKDIDFIFN